jgi:RNA polymerase sigma-B factor
VPARDQPTSHLLGHVRRPSFGDPPLLVDYRRGPRPNAGRSVSRQRGLVVVAANVCQVLLIDADLARGLSGRRLQRSQQECIAAEVVIDEGPMAARTVRMRTVCKTDTLAAGKAPSMGPSLPPGHSREGRRPADDASDRAILEAYRRDREPALRDAMVRRYMPLARRVAARYAGSREPFEDVLQVANLGLIKAVERFDIERGTAFSSYAVPTITGEIRRHFRDKTWMVHVPRDLKELALAVTRVREELESRLGRSPTVAELAAVVDASEEEILEALAAQRAHSIESMDAPPQGRGDDGREEVRADALGQDEAGYERTESCDVFERLVAQLPKRDRLVVRLRFEYDLAQREIGNSLGISQMQVSRILQTSLQRLRELPDQIGGPRPTL